MSDEQAPGTINDERRDQRLLDLVDQWHQDPDAGEIWDYLGMTKPEFAAWVKRHPHLERQLGYAKPEGKIMAFPVQAIEVMFTGASAAWLRDHDVWAGEVLRRAIGLMQTVEAMSPDEYLAVVNEGAKTLEPVIIPWRQ